MHSKAGGWTRAASLLGVFVAILLAPLVLAQSANAATPMETRLSAGTATFTDSAGQQHRIVATAHKSCSQSYCAPAADGRDTYIGISGPYIGTLAFCYLDSRPPASMECSTRGTLTSQDVSGLLEDGSPDAAPIWITAVGQNAYAGLVCLGDPARPGGPNGACGLAADPSSDAYGLPRAEDMGHVGEAGGGAAPLPGQQEDGSVDPIQCIQDSIATTSGQTGGAFDPIGYIFTPVKCAFLWATTMPTDTITDLVATQQGQWDETQAGKIVGAMDFYSAFTVGNNCNGIVIPLSGLRTPGGPVVGNLRILSACTGDQLASLAALVKTGLTLAVVIGGVFAIARMIAQFIKGPSPAPAHESNFNDILFG